MYVKILSTLAISMLTIVSTANAGPNHNCDAFAQEAIKDAKEAKARGCGFTDSLWSLDYNGHKNWCLNPAIQMQNLTWTNNARKQGLKQCKDKHNTAFEYNRKKQKDCLAYARKATKLDAEILNACPSSNAWPKENLKVYVDWCMQKGVGNAKLQNSLRAVKVQECKSADKAKITKKFAHSGVYSKRIRRHLPLDHCSNKVARESDMGLYNHCGKSVADLFCNTKGFIKASKYPMKNYNNGSNMDGDHPSTWWLQDGRPCHGKCKGFSSITCKGKL